MDDWVLIDGLWRRVGDVLEETQEKLKSNSAHLQELQEQVDNLQAKDAISRLGEIGTLNLGPLGGGGVRKRHNPKRFK